MKIRTKACYDIMERALVVMGSNKLTVDHTFMICSLDSDLFICLLNQPDASNAILLVL
jgi:hypothetical protein